MASETQLLYSEVPGATKLTKRQSVRRRESKTRRSFLSRLRSSSNPSVTSVEDNESTFSQDILCKSPQLSQRFSVSNMIPAEVEIVVQDDEDNSLDAISSQPCAPAFERRDESSTFRDFFTVATQTEKNTEMFEPFTRALKCLSCNRIDQAINEVEEGLAAVATTSPYYWRLNVLKAEASARKGNACGSLELFEHVLEQPMNECTPAEFASIYFSCGRLSRILKDYPKALEYHTHELLYMRAMSGNNLDVARTYHDLAYIAQYGLGDWSLAFDYYEQALHIEATLRQRLKVASNFHSSSLIDEQKRLEALQEANHRIQETKKAMGRIQFCLGFVAEGMRLSNHRFQID
jgi:tetratricopeptide (TPR) repeat protein